VSDVQKVVNDMPPELCRIDLMGGAPTGATVAASGE
jgi:hypothetical protein